jgi:hypothetical protein
MWNATSTFDGMSMTHLCKWKGAVIAGERDVNSPAAFLSPKVRLSIVNVLVSVPIQLTGRRRVFVLLACGVQAGTRSLLFRFLGLLPIAVFVVGFCHSQTSLVLGMGVLVAGEAFGVGKKDDLILWKSAIEVTKGNNNALSLHEMRSQTVLTWI